MKRLRVQIAVAALLAGVSAASAQSLGDVARKEAERRGATPTSRKVYTNDTLTPDFTEPAPSAAAGPAQRPDGPATEKAAAADNVAANPEEAAKWGVTPLDQQEPGPKDDLNEEFWRARAALIRARMAEQTTNVEQLRGQLAAVPRDAANGEREVVERAFQRAQTNLEHINAEWLRFERQARERKVPEHWIR